MNARTDKTAGNANGVEVHSNRVGQRRSARAQGGMTLVEVCVALALATMMCGGLYVVGLKALNFAQNDRLATEARAAGKQRLEEVMATGRTTLAQGGSSCTRTATNTSTMGYSILIQPAFVWHTPDGTVTQSSAAAYAEVLVSVTYRSLLSKKNVTDTYSMVLSE